MAAPSSQHKGRQSDAQTDLFVQRCSCKSQKQQADDGPIARIKIELCPWPSGDPPSPGVEQDGQRSRTKGAAVIQPAQRRE